MGECDLEHLGRALQRQEAAVDLFDGDRQARQASQAEHPRQRKVDGPPLERGPRLARVQIAGDQAHAVVVELVAEEEPCGLALVEADRDHGAAAADDTDGVVQSAR
jgi:hypothetical protein